MNNNMGTNLSNARNRKREARRENWAQKRLLDAARTNVDKFLNDNDWSCDGLSPVMVKMSRQKYGDNKIVHENKKSLARRLFGAFVNPFTVILLILASVSFVTDILCAAPGEHDYVTVTVIMTMVFISGMLRFVQETRSGSAAERLNEMVETTARVKRKGFDPKEIPLDEIVVGDIVQLAAGDMVPADVRILKSKDLFINQSALTGESIPLEKTPKTVENDPDIVLTECSNLAFMGSNVVSGTAVCLVVSTGSDTQFGGMAKSIVGTEVQTGFEKGVNSVSWVLIRFMLVMVPIVLFINGFTKGDWFEAFLFAISVAVGLTPEMLPMIVTTCLARGAVAMSRKKTIIKKLNSIQNFGAVDVLCTDKTGTLTQDKVVLEYHLDVMGNEDTRILRHAFLNSYYQTGLKNLMDIAIIRRTEEEGEDIEHLTSYHEKVDEIPFDFERRRMSVVVAEKTGYTEMITKGAVEEILDICSEVEYEGKIERLTEGMKEKVLATVDTLNGDGLRVVAVAQKKHLTADREFSVVDESEMCLMGYIAFLDPPKETAEEAIRTLDEHGIAVKILTGDNERVTKCICRQVGLRVDNILLGSDLDRMNGETLKAAVEETNVFAKLSPQQKSRVVRTLRENGHTVGFLGDGINDAAAMKSSDIGISVDTAVDIAKESADVILLEKNLLVLEDGIIEGRKTYANMIKYIKMTASSNFGNVFSVLCASAFLPFLPMAPIHLVLLNLIYDISCTAIPWDNVDGEFIRKPKKWNASSVGSFMLWIGPTSSVFDITTYLLMYFIVCPAVCGGMLFTQLTDPAMQLLYIGVFQAGWFVESMWSQTLVIHMIRTGKVPFIESRASGVVTLLTCMGIVMATCVPFTPLGTALGLKPLPMFYFYWLALTIALYMVLVTVLKKLYIRKYGELL